MSPPTPAPLRLLPLLAMNALACLLTAAVLLLRGGHPPQLAAHAAFAAGVMPLILAAMAYFLPVLTRGASGGVGDFLPAMLAWAGGLLAVWAFASDFALAKLHPGATLAGLGALLLLAQGLRRARAAFGPRHPCVDWYLAALGFLLLALAAVLLMPALPAHHRALRLFHLHANLLGFVGLTALGTLQVLMPTCAGRADPEASVRLRRDLKWAAGGAFLVALAVPWGLTFALPGLALWLMVLARMLRAWWPWRDALLSRHGAAASLHAATLGLVMLLLLAPLHGAGGLSGRAAVAGFVVAFLLPLVSGAASHLLPVWWRPGRQESWHHAWRERLGRQGGLRAWLMLLAGLAMTIGAVRG